MNRYVTSEFQSHASKNMDYTEHITYLYEIIEFLILFHYDLYWVWPTITAEALMTLAVMHVAVCAYLYILCSYLHTFANGLGSSLADNEGFRTQYYIYKSETSSSFR
jgi:hypothetical protein